MKKKHIVVAAVFTGVILAISIWTVVPKKMSSVLHVSRNNAQECSVIQNGSSGASVSMSHEQLINFVDLIERTTIKYSGIDPSVMRPIDSEEYLVRLKTTGDIHSFSITSDGYLFFKDVKFRISETTTNSIIVYLENIVDK